MKNLQELTNRESGIVLYENNAILCNWCGIEGFPGVFITGVIGMGEEIPEPEETYDVDDMLAHIGDAEIMYNVMEDEQFMEEFASPVPATVFEFEHCTVYAPHNWC